MTFVAPNPVGLAEDENLLLVDIELDLELDLDLEFTLSPTPCSGVRMFNQKKGI